MSDKIRAAKGQSVAYASVYAVQVPSKEYGEAFAAYAGITTWPCMAHLFDDATKALDAMHKLGVTGARVVRLTLQYVAEAAEMVRPALTHPTRRPKKVA